MAKKFYAVKNGRKPGVYETWDETKNQVEGYQNAVYKGFQTKEEAFEFLGLSNNKNKSLSNAVISFTDGSYRAEDNSYSYGAVIYLDDSEIRLSQRFSDEFSDQRNVAGELWGAAKVLEYAYNNGIQNLEIHHDYRGVGAWATGEWKANIELTKKYVDFYKKASKKVKVKFVWVKGHSGDESNDLVDQLAKDATFTFKQERVNK